MNVYTTKTSGEVMITQYCNIRVIHIIFLNTGYETIVDRHVLENGTAHDPYAPSVYGKGFMGVGPYKSHAGGQMAKEYVCWRHMIRTREVCDEWLNFQNFAEWYFDNHKEGDRLRCDAEVYSPETAKFVKHAEIIRKRKYEGCYYKETIGKWRAFDELYIIGDYDTGEEAERAFIEYMKVKKPRE